MRFVARGVLQVTPRAPKPRPVPTGSSKAAKAPAQSVATYGASVAKALVVSEQAVVKRRRIGESPCTDDVAQSRRIAHVCITPPRLLNLRAGKDLQP